MADHVIVAHVGNLGDPLFHLSDVGTLTMNDANGDLCRPKVVRPVEGYGAQSIAVEALVSFATELFSRRAMGHETMC